MTDEEGDAASLRRAFNKAAETFPGSVTAFLNRRPTPGRTSVEEREADKLMAWWAKFYDAIHGHTAGLKLLAELQAAKEKAATA